MLEVFIIYTIVYFLFLVIFCLCGTIDPRKLYEKSFDRYDIVLKPFLCLILSLILHLFFATGIVITLVICWDSVPMALILVFYYVESKALTISSFLKAKVRGWLDE